MLSTLPVSVNSPTPGRPCTFCSRPAAIGRPCSAWTAEGVAAAAGACRAHRRDLGPSRKTRPTARRTRTPRGWLTSNELLASLGLATLRQIAPRLRWIHIIGAGIEPLLPLDWLGDGLMLTNNSGVHFDKMRESGLDGAADAQRRRAGARDQPAPGAVGADLFHAHRRQDGIDRRRRRHGRRGRVGSAGTRHAGARGHAQRRTGIPTSIAWRASMHSTRCCRWRISWCWQHRLTLATRNMLDARRIALMRPGAALFNIGRGRPGRSSGAGRGAGRRTAVGCDPGRVRSGAAAGGIAAVAREERADHAACHVRRSGCLSAEDL